MVKRNAVTTLGIALGLCAGLAACAGSLPPADERAPGQGRPTPSPRRASRWHPCHPRRAPATRRSPPRELRERSRRWAPIPRSTRSASGASTTRVTMLPSAPPRRPCPLPPATPAPDPLQHRRHASGDRRRGVSRPRRRHRRLRAHRPERAANPPRPGRHRRERHRHWAGADYRANLPGAARTCVENALRGRPFLTRGAGSPHRHLRVRLRRTT